MSEQNDLSKRQNQSRKSVLVIAANDSAGMAGISTDIKTLAAFKLHCTVVVTANTAQNNQGVLSINPVSEQVLSDQLAAVSALELSVVKVGLIANLAQAKIIANFVEEHQLPMVLDPVLSASSQHDFLSPESVRSYGNILLPLCKVVTPNRQEATKLTSLPCDNHKQIETAAIKLRQLGTTHCVIKGGIGILPDRSKLALEPEEHHSYISTNKNFCNDFFSSKDLSFWLSSPAKQCNNTRGTGCAFASSLTAAIALEYSVEDAVLIAKMAINQGIRNNYSIRNGKRTRAEKGPVSIEEFPKHLIDLPVLTQTKITQNQPFNFPTCQRPLSKKIEPLGLYPVVDRASWIKKLSTTGVSTIQLRVKDLNSKQLENEIIQAIKIAQQHDIRLFINDYWQLAIKHKAYGVHLGQEDLEDADIQQIHASGLRLGISTHCHYEVAKAHAFNPSYIAVGPVYPTQSKIMPWQPQGIAGINYWLELLNSPVIAIGGINQQNFTDLTKTGVDGIAMISAITLAKNPEQVCREFVQQFDQRK